MISAMAQTQIPTSSPNILQHIGGTSLLAYAVHSFETQFAISLPKHLAEDFRNLRIPDPACQGTNRLSPTLEWLFPSLGNRQKCSPSGFPRSEQELVYLLPICSAIDCIKE